MTDIPSNNLEHKFKFNIDRGGTFTDIYCEYTFNNTINTKTTKKLVDKLLSSDPSNYEDAPAEGIRRIINKIANLNIKKSEKIPSDFIESIRMGTTIATNNLLERKGEKCALLITKGFRDLIEIGNQTRPNIFDLKIEKPEKLYDCVFEVNERVRVLNKFEKNFLEKKNISKEKNFQEKNIFENNELLMGITNEEVEIIEKIEEEEIRRILTLIKEKDIESIAVAFAHSYAYPNHEKYVKKIAKEIGLLNISLSCEIMPLVKFYPRGSTAVVDAYLTPSISKYVSRFISYFDNPENINVLFMQSDGGLTGHNNFIGSRAIISGPAAGVVGYSLTTNKELPNMPIIGLDMGGTSTDVSRYENGWDHVFEILISGVAINAPQIDVNTVAAGGGSRLFYKNGMYVVGPESAGAHPGPVCYRKNGYLTVTDANLLLGRIIPKYFPNIFGKNCDQSLSYEDSYLEMEKITKNINQLNSTNLSTEEVAYGFIKVANEEMCRPIRLLTQSKGYNPKDHILSVFGGAGGQHACAIAKILGIKKAYIHKYAGILSAFGLSLSNIIEEIQEPSSAYLDSIEEKELESRFISLEKNIKNKLLKMNYERLLEKNHININELETNKNDKFDLLDKDYEVISERYLLLKYEGNDFNLTVKENKLSNFTKDFEKVFKREYGFLLEKRRILIDNLRVRITLVPKSEINQTKEIENNQENINDDLSSNDTSEKEGFINAPIDKCFVFYENANEQCDLDKKFVKMETNVYKLEKLRYFKDPEKSKFNVIQGPALIMSGNSTIVIEPDCTGNLTSSGSLVIDIHQKSEGEKNEEKNQTKKTEKNALELSLFANRFMGIAEEMGRHLQRTAVSTNIKERLDFSCALFDNKGNLVANAPHLPVHLGAMQEVVKRQIEILGESWEKNEVILCNHPQAGGSHLPDMTVLTPVFHNEKVIFYLGNRGHHSDIGGLTPGSMPPFSKNLDEEGAAFFSFKVIDKNGFFMEEELKKVLVDDLINKNLRPTANLADNISDLKAQVAANNRGLELVKDLVEKNGLNKVLDYMEYIQESAENSVREMLDKFAEEKCGISLDESGTVNAEDYMDDGSKIKLQITINRKDKSCHFDFTGTSPQVYGNINTPKSIVYSAIIYSLRCMINSTMPLNQGCLKPVKISIPKSSLLWPDPECAVVGGNVTTSQRITDIILKAFGACAASQGCMNNFTFGCENFGYYETIGGGAGAGPDFSGQNGVQVHMTNTRITDVEIIERRYPLIIWEFSYRKNSGGLGKFTGGNGIIRSFGFFADLEASILSERRVFEPFGIEGGDPGKKGKNILLRKNGYLFNIGSKNSVKVSPGDRILIKTPGGGGFGKFQVNDKKENKEDPKANNKNEKCMGSLNNFTLNQNTN